MFGLQLDPEEQQLLPFRGMPVCLLMKDGTRKVGQLTACTSGRLTLNGGTTDAADVTISRKAATRRTKRPRARKLKENPIPAQPVPPQQPFDDFSLDGFGLNPLFSSLPRENVPLQSVDSILVL